MSFLPSLSPGNVTRRLPTGFKFDNDLTYDRPTGWLDLGINAAYGATGVPEKIKGLVAIYPNDIAPAHNYAVFHCDTSDDSHILVDWGDGNPAETGHQSDFSSDVDGYGISSHGSVSQSGTYNGKTGVLVYADFGGRPGIRNNSVDLLSGNNYTVTFDYYADAAFNGDVWGIEYSFANNVSLANNAPSIETGVWTGASLTIPATRPSSSTTEVLHIRPQDNANSNYASNTSTTGKIGFQNIKVVVNNSGSGYYVKENVNQFHVYDHDIITGDTSITKSTLFRGYKQAIFEVSLQGSAKFTQIDLGNLDGPFTQTSSNERTRGSSILDLFVSTSNATNVIVSQSRPLTLTEQIEVRNTSSNRILHPRATYQGCRSLQSIPFVPWVRNTSAIDWLDCFKECRSLKFLPDEFANEDKAWLKRSTRFQSTFQNCHELRYLPEGIFSNNIHTSCSTFFRMFINCFKLRYIPYIGVRTGSGEDTRFEAMMTNCKALTKLPKGLNIQRAQTGSGGIQSMIEFCFSVKDFSSLFDGDADTFTNMNGSSFSFLSTFRGLQQLREFPFIGQFTKCSNASNMFMNGENLTRFNSAYTHLDFSNATKMQQVFSNCSNLQEIPEIKVRSVTDDNGFASTFSNCFMLRSVKFTGMIAGPANGEYQRMFMSCHNLTCIDGVDFSFATETSDYFQMTNTCRNINAIKFPGTHRKGATRIIVTVANHSDISGEYHITADGTGYAQASGNGVLTVAESSGNYVWTIKDSSDNTPTETSAAASTTQYTPWDADWSGATNAVTFTEVETGFKYTISGNSGDGIRYNPIPRTQMLEIFNQLVTISHSATIDIRNNSYTSDLTADDIAIATNKGWTVSTNEGTFT